MGSSNYVEVGRVAFVNYGEYTSKYVVILDVVDSSRVLVDGPTTGVPRQTMPLKRLSLTSLVIPTLPRSARSITLLKYIKHLKVDEKAAATGLGKRFARSRIRANLTDFERFVVKKLKRTRSTKVNTTLKAIIKANKA